MFSLSCLLLGAFLILCGWFVYTRIANLETLWKAVPRERNIGGILAFIALTYSAYHGRYMLEGGLEYLRVYVWVLLPIVTVLVYLFLDYVFARSLGGVLVITAVHLTHEAFSQHLPLRAIFSLDCYLLGTARLFIIGMPWLLRDLLDQVRKNKKVALGFSTYLVVSGLFFIVASML